MVINILSSHRFHLLDLSRELSRQGHDVRFYSYVPAQRCAEFGLEPDKCSSFVWLVAPFFLFEKIAPKSWRNRIIWYRNLLIDWYVSHTMRRCEVLIALGSVYYSALDKAKHDFEAKTILEWGSKHIVEELIYSGQLDDYPKRNLERELQSYQRADYIAIASQHVKESFLKHGIPASKLLVNAYGVDLSLFHATQCSQEYDLIMVGGWSFRKGCDLLMQLCKLYGYRLLHVGPLVDLDFLVTEKLQHHEAVDQSQLPEYYAKAKVFILPSRTEGLAMVQAQAIACGLPVVCSKETGGSDLRKLLGNTPWVVEMTSYSLDSLHEAVTEALALTKTQEGLRNYTGEALTNLSWETYGIRYHQHLLNIKNDHDDE